MRATLAHAAVLLTAALVVAVILFGAAPQEKEHAIHPRSPRVLTRSGGKPAPRLDPRPFLEAFLRYEVGAKGTGLRRALGRSTTAEFAAELLAAHPSTPRGVSFAQITHLRTTYLSRNPPRALVSGAALRAGRPEPFAFLFEARRGRWLAAGPAE